jgi:hypothetical protein
MNAWVFEGEAGEVVVETAEDGVRVVPVGTLACEVLARPNDFDLIEVEDLGSRASGFRVIGAVDAHDGSYILQPGYDTNGWAREWAGSPQSLYAFGLGDRARRNDPILYRDFGPTSLSDGHSVDAVRVTHGA